MASLPSKLKLFSRELDWLSEILSDSLALSSTKGKEAFKSFNEVYNNKSITGEQAEESFFTLVKYNLHFDYITLHSLFVTAYSFFEHFILDFGSKIEELSESNTKIADIDSEGGEVNRVRKYLFSVHNFKSASSDAFQWNDLVNFQQVRNLINHNQSKLKNKKSENEHLKPFLKKFDARITNTGMFQIRNKEFMERFKVIALSFTDALANDCCKMFKENKAEAGG